MSSFIYNIGVFTYAFASWFFAGLGLGLILLPKNRQRDIFLLAPLFGLCFLTLLGVFQITVLLVPYTPRANICVLLLISLWICLRNCRQNLQIAWEKFSVTLSWLWFLPILLMLVFAWMFHSSELHLLVGSSDQLQYCENARQILEEMHTGSLLDEPVARQDHFIYEINTRILPYLKSYRRGAELMLANITAITGLSYQSAFPITILNALLTLGLAIGFISRCCLRLSRFYSLIMQLIFLSSFYLLLLHIQGSLAMVLAMAPSLVSLAYLSKVIDDVCWKNIVATALIVATYLSIYVEPALVNIIIPTVILLIWQFFKSKYNFFVAVRSISFIYLLVFIFAPFAVYSAIYNAEGNFMLLISPYLKTFTTATTYKLIVRQWIPSFSLQTWNVTSVILGIISYYDISHFNTTLNHFFTRYPFVTLVAFGLFSGCGLLGCLKSKKPLGFLLAAPLVLWMLIVLVAGHQQDYLRFTRSQHYVMPFAMIGLVLLASQYRWSRHFKFKLGELSKVILLGFIIMNSYAIARTVHFITSHNTGNDPILLRFDVRSKEWRSLKKELQYSVLRHTPVLISGFQETIRPFAISIVLHSQTHVLGTSILALWKIYNIDTPHLKSTKLIAEQKKITLAIGEFCSTEFFNSVYRAFQPYQDIVLAITKSYVQFSAYTKSKEYLWWSRCNTRLSASKVRLIQRREGRPWGKVEGQLIGSSEQAVVPANYGYPVEWLSTKDVFAPKIKHFPNICNVIYRHKYAVTIAEKMTSPLMKDTQGGFRWLLISGPIIIHDKKNSPQLLTLEYEGQINDLKLLLGNKLYKGILQNGDNRIKIVATVYTGDISSLWIVIAHPVKLRSMFLSTMPSAKYHQ